jgi:hypothetical protein
LPTDLADEPGIRPLARGERLELQAEEQVAFVNPHPSMGYPPPGRRLREKGVRWTERAEE